MNSGLVLGAHRARLVRRGAVLLALIGASLAGAFALAATTADAASLVYVKAGNVYVANSDGSDPHQVTTDGAASTGSGTDDSAYRDPSIADNGTILADKGGQLYFLSENGTVVSAREPGTRAYPLDSAISPDGTHVAYNYSEITQCVTYDFFSCGYYPAPGAEIEGANGTGGQDASGQRFTEDAEWLDNSTVVLDTDTSYVDYDTIGQGEADWFVPSELSSAVSDLYPHEPTVSRAGDLLVVVMRGAGGNPSTTDLLSIWKLNGPPPAAPTPLCSIKALDAGGIEKPSIAPDDSGIVWTDAAGVEYLPYDADTRGYCQDDTVLQYTPDNGTLIPGASQASFGEAANDPPPLPPAGTPGAGTSGGGGASGAGGTPGGGTPGGGSPGGGSPRGTTGGGSGSGSILAAVLAHPDTLTAEKLIEKGIALKISCDEACRYTISVTVSSRVARTLGLAHRGHGSVSLSVHRGSVSAGRHRLTIRLSAKPRSALAGHHGTTRALLVLRARAGTGAAVTHRYRLLIRAARAGG